MSYIENNILKSKTSHKSLCREEPGESFISRIFERIDIVIQNGQADRKWLTDIADFNEPKFRRFGEIKPLSYQVASALKANGLQAGDVVQLYLPNSVDYYLIAFGAWLCGAIVSMSDSSLKCKSIESQIEDVHPKIVFCTEDNFAEVEQGCPGCPLIVLDHEFGPCKHLTYEGFLAMGQVTAMESPEVNIEDCVLIFWSSGTTGNPKGIQHSHRNMINFMVADDFTRANLLATTMFPHIGGFTIPICASIFGTYDIVFYGHNFPVESHHIFEAIYKYKPQFLVIGSHHAVHLASAPHPKNMDLSSVKAVYPIGSATYAGLLEDLRQHLPNLTDILNYYGLTEIGALSNSLSSFNLGTLRDGREAKIVNPETNELLGPNEIGEIWGKTPTTTIGYVNRPTLNKESFGLGGFFRTGDLGYFDEEGLLYFHDRLKDLIKYKNNHVYPGDLEAIIQKHPDVVEVAIFGIPEPTVQELVSALVVKRPGSQLNEKDVRDLVLKEDLEYYKQVRGPIKFVDRLPRNHRGKIVRRTLKDC
eukprot:maker-scaffold326_size205590-snap-gene-0.12 protein:Tk02470 transcript:maker-scaffold326_size205590-snap-gene-0.12-mRNA-1 annotation:"hypothetical protein DAPPUDRAFT_204305"